MGETNVMKEMGWSWEDLMKTPYEDYLDIQRILALQADEASDEAEGQKRKMNRHL